ncbi:MAG: hypothetical protein JST75_09365 [Bacteroidetes bacterium]|nr:hypothetical protein [Bacteroidota bacterium]
MKITLPGVIFTAIFLPLSAFCQTKADSVKVDSIVSTKLAQKYISTVSKKADGITNDLDKKTEKYISDLQKQEAKIQRKLSKVDSLASKNIFSKSPNVYDQLRTDLQNKSDRLLKGSGQYISWLDTAGTTLKFFQNNAAFKNISAGQSQLKNAFGKIHSLDDQLKQAENVKEFIRQRKEYLKQQLASYNFGSELKNYNQTAYYYAQQVNEYKAALDDPTKLEKKALEILNKIPAFQDFMKKNSLLAGLFNIPEDYGTSGVAGLQTREVVQQLMSERMSLMGPAGAQTAQANILDAQSQLTQLRDKFMKTGTGGEIPDFKPNDQKTKKFLKRLEYGVNLQTAHSTYYFPTTTDIGFSVGYKLSEKNIIGIGGSAKIGWGTDIRHIAVTGQGLGVRSFLDMKIKGNFYASGGFEYNYQKTFNSLQQVNEIKMWQQSGLIGLSKMISLKSKMIKKTKLQLLWDVLSYYQTPRTQPIKFRVGYNF